MLLWFRNLTIFRKILVPVSMVILVAVAIILYASQAVTGLSKTASDLVDGNATRVQLALQAESSFNSAAVSEKNVILTPEAEAVRKNVELYGKAVAATLDSLDHLAVITTAPAQRGAIDAFRTAVEARRDASNHVFELVGTGKQAEAVAYSSGVAAEQRRVAVEAVGRLISLNVEDMRRARDEAVARAGATRDWLVGGAALGLLCAFGVLGWIVLHEVSRPVTEMTDEM